MQRRTPEDDKPLTGFRWTVCALIFFATTVNYLDRQLFANLVPFFEDDLKLGPTDIALINVGFIVPYGAAMLFVGRFIDRVGIRLGLGCTFLLWTIASVCHAFVGSLAAFVGVRFLLGVGESGMYPGAVKTLTDWFPVRERGTAIGIFNAGANLGVIVALLAGVPIAIHYGWRVCFVALGSVGAVWIFFWLLLYRRPAEHPKVSASELQYIHRDGDLTIQPISYARLFGMRNVYGLAIAKALTDGPWWFILLWLPKILVDQFHTSKWFMAFALPIVFVISDIGSVAGGWASSHLVKAGRSLNFARKSVMLTCAACVLPVGLVGSLVDHPSILGVPTVYWAILIFSLAAAAHQGWSSNLFTIISDTVPKGSMAMAVGAINGYAMVGVAAMQLFVGGVVQLTSSYSLPFIVAGFLYLVAFGFLHVIVPRVEPYPTVREAKLPWVFAGAAATLAGLALMLFVANRPPYTSVANYLAVRRGELHAVGGPTEGPPAKVGWMQARWYSWSLPGGGHKLELIKLDTHGHPFIEEKGSKAAKYSSPATG